MTDKSFQEKKENIPNGNSISEKPPFEEPKLEFIEPKLTPRGDLRNVTAGFFGPFSP